MLVGCGVLGFEVRGTVVMSVSCVMEILGCACRRIACYMRAYTDSGLRLGVLSWLDLCG